MFQSQSKHRKELKMASVPQRQGRNASKLMEVTFQHAIKYLDGLDSMHVANVTSLDELREKLSKPFPVVRTDSLIEVINSLVDDTSGGLLGCVQVEVLWLGYWW
jgi:hypothetical protein